MSCSFTNALFLFGFLRLSYIYILQGSVAMQSVCGGIFSSYFIAYCLESVLVKEFGKSVNIS